MIADRISALRAQRRMTQSELAEKLGVARASVNAWEMGISSPSSQYLVRLAQVFGVSTDFLLGVPERASISAEGLNEKDILIVTELVGHLREKNNPT